MKTTSPDTALPNRTSVLSSLIRNASSDAERIELYESSQHQLYTNTSSDGQRTVVFERVAINMVLNSYCKLGKVDSAVQIMTSIAMPEADTVRTVLMHCLRTPERAVLAEELFHRYFESSSSSALTLTARTLNIMMEGFRALDRPSKVLQYYDLFASLHIEPDWYSRSIRVRSARSREECMSLVAEATAVPYALYEIAPFLRCCIETLGMLGYPDSAYEIAGVYLAGTETVKASRDSGDSLLAALLSGPTISSSNITCFSKYSTSNKYQEIPLLVVAVKEILRGDLFYGPKGLCIIFSHMQRLRQKQGVFDETSIDRYRDQIWKHAIEKSVINSGNLNGRICDAFLRSFNDDVDRAKAVWITQLLPLAGQVRIKRGDYDYMEITEKSLEAMMFVSGRSHSPDLALEIAKSVRKRNWSLQLRKKLAMAYCRGRSEMQRSEQVKERKKNVFVNIVNDGIEKSIESELGVLFERLQDNNYKKGGFPLIRLKLK